MYKHEMKAVSTATWANSQTLLVGAADREIRPALVQVGRFMS